MFDYALQMTLHHEGGFVDDPDDPGGATYRGISLRFLEAIEEDVDRDGDVDADDVISLRGDPEGIKDLYFRHFWEPNRLDEIQSGPVACKIFDMAVNMGSRQAWRIAQTACNMLHSPNIAVDGIVGPATIGCVNDLADVDFRLLGSIRTAQAQFYANLIASRPELRKFRLGWMRRAAA
jgi:lysozyme family protein